MKIKISPCFLCGAKSSYRAKSRVAEFNGCQQHQDALHSHAKLLFNEFTWYSESGTSQRFKWDGKEDWKQVDDGRE